MATVVSKEVRDHYMGRCNGPDFRLDYHECEDVDALTCILNDIVQSGFLLEKIIPQPYGRFVVLFRRHDIG